MTVMMLIVVVVLFNNIIAEPNNGTRKHIETIGGNANERIRTLSP